LEAAGFSTVFATDIDPYSIRTLKLGKVASEEGGRPFLAHAYIAPPVDIRELSTRSMVRNSGFGLGEFSLLAGGPPARRLACSGNDAAGSIHEANSFSSTYESSLKRGRPP
jgi:site-specific DNA-cytosine methylase